MAVCEIWDVRGRLDHPIDYAENPEKTANPKYTEDDLQAMVDVMEYATNKNKTEQRFFVTGVNCDPTTARDEMDRTSGALPEPSGKRNDRYCGRYCSTNDSTKTCINSIFCHWLFNKVHFKGS